MNILFCCPSRFNLNSKIINSLGGIENLVREYQGLEPLPSPQPWSQHEQQI